MSHPQGSAGPTRNPNSSQQNRQTPLFRGAGCHHCRQRKVKCDAGKPYCARCVSQNTTDKCRYDEVKKSKLTLYKEENSRLKERIAALERAAAQLAPDPLVVTENIKTPPSEVLSKLQLAEVEEDRDEEDEETYQETSEPRPYETRVDDSVQTQQSYSAEQYPTTPSHHRVPPNAYPEPQQHIAQPGYYPTVPGQYSQPGQHYSQYDSHANNSYYAESGRTQADTFQAAGFIPVEQHTPQTQYGSRLTPEAHWSNNPGPTSASSASSFTPSPSGNQWQQLPYIDPNNTPASPGGTPFRSPTNYSQGTTFGAYGTYHGGAMPSYDAYQGAPNQQAAIVTRRRPVPSPPVFGQDVIMTFFRQWKHENQTRASIESEYSGTPNPYNGSWALVGNWWERDDLPVPTRDQLLEMFLPYRQQVGLEIWLPDFLTSLHNPPKRRPHPGLMWMIYTFAAKFSGDAGLVDLVPQFLERAKRNLEDSFAKSDRLFNYIQGQTLYASILYMEGRVNEAHQATHMACHAAILCGLHKISSAEYIPRAQPNDRLALRLRQVDFQIPPATSAREHGERIAAFWQLVIVDLTAAATTGLPAMFRDDGDERSRVETVLPRTIEEYMNGKAADVPYATLQDVLTPKSVPNILDTDKTLQVKASALLERAVRLATMWSNGTHASKANPQKYMNEYEQVRLAIEHFRTYLPSIYPQNPHDSALPQTSNGLIWERVYPYQTMLNAQVQLYNILEETNSAAYASCLTAAREIKLLIDQLTDVEVSQLGVMLGHCLTGSAHVLLRELRHCQQRGDESGAAIANQELDVVHHGLDIVGEQHYLVSVMASKAKQARLEYWTQ